ncbi:unnamed protein product [Sphagnum troendelagicum]|uniref:histidine kinase n=1 Tax=Sphagnum troendelagicum TaxID=128251 RepID=A0ABP0U9T1_9BRYO
MMEDAGADFFNQIEEEEEFCCNRVRKCHPLLSSSGILQPTPLAPPFSSSSSSSSTNLSNPPAAPGNPVQRCPLPPSPSSSSSSLSSSSSSKSNPPAAVPRNPTVSNPNFFHLNVSESISTKSLGLRPTIIPSLSKDAEETGVMFLLPSSPQVTITTALSDHSGPNNVAIGTMTVSPSSSNDVIIPPLKCASEIVASVESWQKTMVELVVENEQLRKQVQHLRKVLDDKETACQSAGKTRELCLDEEANNNFGLKTHLSRDDDDEVHICSLKRDFTKDLHTQQQEAFSGREHLKLSSASSEQGEQHGNNNSYEDVKLVLERMCGIESLLSMISNHVPIIIISHCDANLRYTYIKFVHKPLEHVCSQDILGLKDVDLVGVIPGALEMMEMKKEVLCTGIANRRELNIEVEADDGVGARLLVIACEPLFGNEGGVLGVATALIDVTEQAMLRERLAQMKDEVAKREVTEKKLRHAIAAADEAMEAKNSFLAVMSHEIRTPLNGVLGMAQILATTPLNSEQKELVDAMVFSGDVLLAIISDILDLSKVEAGTMELEEQGLNPRDIVKHVVRTAIAATRERNISIQAIVADDVPTLVIGDPLRIKQVITNLVFNAVKFTKRGYVKVRLRVVNHPKTSAPTQCLDNLSSFSEGYDSDHILENSVKPAAAASSSTHLALGKVDRKEISPEVRFSEQMNTVEWNPLLEGGRRDIPEDILLTVEEDKAEEQQQLLSDPNPTTSNAEGSPDIWLQYEIEDTGIGIPKGAFPLLFEKFTQVHSSTTRKYGGTGLGLAICKQLVQLMGGQILAQSEEGKGSTFTFTVRCKCPTQAIAAGPIKTVSETKLKKNLCHSTAQLHKLQAGMLNPLCSRNSAMNLQLLPRMIKSEQQETRSADSSLKLHNGNNNNNSSAFSSLGSHEKSKVLTCAAGARGGQGAFKENEGGVQWSGRWDTASNGLRRTSSGPPRIECLFMPQFEESKSLGIIESAAAPKAEKNAPLLLLAEDNKVNVMVAMSMLKRLGLAADVAYNGLEAIKALQTKCYDLVLMDICMPLMDGLEVTKHIREFERCGYWDKKIIQATSESGGASWCQPAYRQLSSTAMVVSQENFPIGGGRRHLPIVAMTANALSNCEDQCSKTGMDSFMTKPVTFKKLKDVLDHFLS